MRKPCCDKKEINKGAWSKQEDQKLMDYIQKHGEGFWRTLPLAAGLLRCGKSCRLRWINYLRPDLKRGNFAEDEEELIIKLHALLGNRWSLIAGRLPGRTDNEVKNYWNSHLRRKLLDMGIDPNNHRLSDNIIRHPQLNPQYTSSNSISTGSKGPAQIQADKSCVGDCEQVISDESCLEDNSFGLPDLNIELTIRVPTPIPSTDVNVEQKYKEPNLPNQQIISQEIEPSNAYPLQIIN